ncbi:hypothetical protein CQW23_10869 [Capsicum baccatum]|uniref:BED-type domain-containing protein n=1 Tax=Capsicum baccatum TaxID=33114 RepID=A0A2G2X0V6_CAPBA|nr:hypothetical protein CQW23_10869 [Capsicum baccatum]
MDNLRNLATKGVKKFCPGSGSGSKKRITSGRGSSSSRYTRVPSPSVPLGTPFEEEIGVGAHDMDNVEAQENYGIEEENEVDAVNLDEDNENIAETSAVVDANVRSESVNLPFRPLSAPKPHKRTSIAWQFFECISDIEVQCTICQQIYKHRSGGKQGGTGTLMRHITEDHKRELNIVKGGGDVGGSTQTRMDPATGQVAKKYNKLRDREEIAKMRWREEDEEEEFDSKRRRAASQFFELEADVDSDENGDSDDSNAEDDFIDDARVDERDNFAARQGHVIHPQIGEDEDEEDIEEFERRIEERYGRKSKYEEEEDTIEVFQQALLPTVTDSKLWMVKCAIGHEKDVAACLMQKQIDKAFKLQIKSVIALDHLQNFIYIEADKEYHVREACKGMRNIFLKNKMVMVPIKEMSDVLTMKKREREFPNGSWVRMKRGTYKGDLAQIVNGDDIRRRVTVKLIPRIDFRALVNQFDGIKIPKEDKCCPPARFWSATKAKALGIPVTWQKDSVTGDYFDTVNDLEKFRGARGDDNDRAERLSFSTLPVKNLRKKHLKEGDRVVVLNGELKTIQGRVLRVDDDVVYLKPESEGLPQSVAIHSKDLCKIFELCDYVKVVSGGKEGATGTITSVKGHVVTVLPDKSINTFDVLADHVEENCEVAYCRVSPRSVSIPNIRPLPPPKKGYRIANFRRPPSPQKKGYDFGRARRDPLLNARIKIRQGLHNGMVGRVVEVRGRRVSVELEAQMNHAYVDRSQIYEIVEADNSSCAEERYGLGSETPMYCPRTPLRP